MTLLSGLHDVSCHGAPLVCWCGASGWRAVFRTPRFGLVRCQSCGSYRIDPPPIANEAEAAAFYTDYYARPEGRDAPRPAVSPLARGSRFWRVAEQVAELNRIGQVALDVGCGEGRLCGELRRAGWPVVVGVDVSRTRISRARQSHPDVVFSDRPVAELGLAPRSVDLIVMDNVVEHLTEPASLIAQLRRYLAPHGLLVVITPNMRSGNFRSLGRRWTPELAPH